MYLHKKGKIWTDRAHCSLSLEGLPNDGWTKGGCCSIGPAKIFVNRIILSVNVNSSGCHWYIETNAKRYWGLRSLRYKKVEPTSAVKKKHRRPTWLWEQILYTLAKYNQMQDIILLVTSVTSTESMPVIFAHVQVALNSLLPRSQTSSEYSTLW